MKIYGIKTCDSVKKALKFFKENEIEVEFIDFKITSVSSDEVTKWLEKTDIAKLFNSRSTTYRNLKLKELNLDDEGKFEWLCKENLLIKRPVIELDDNSLIVGFNLTEYKEKFLT